MQKQLISFSCIISQYNSSNIDASLFTPFLSRTSTLILATGTVPVHYKDSNQYNLPVTIWLPERYPLVPPMAYVNPTATMQINQKCPYVDSNGIISSEYLRKWDYPASTLTDFVGDLQIIFSDTFPLYAKRSGNDNTVSPSSQQHAVHAVNPLTARPQRPPQQPPSAAFPTSTVWSGVLQHLQQPEPSRPQQSGAASTAGPSLWDGVLNPPEAAQAQEAQQAQQQAEQQRDAAYRAALTTALSARLGSALEAGSRSDLERQQAIEQELRSRQASLSTEVSRLKAERQNLDSAAHKLAAASSALDRWLVRG